MSPVQKNKMTELVQKVHGKDADADVLLEQLFQAKFQHGLAQATYEESARMTGQLLAELRQKTEAK
jgi:hypothetical protein